MTFRSRRKKRATKLANRDETVRSVSRQAFKYQRSGKLARRTTQVLATQVPAVQVPVVLDELTTLTIVFSDRSRDNRGPVMSVQTRHNSFDSLFDFAGAAIRTIIFPVLVAIMIALWQPGTAAAQETVVRSRTFCQRDARACAGGAELRTPQQKLVRAAPWSKCESRMVCLQCRAERDGGDLRQRDRHDLCRPEPGDQRLCPLARRRGPRRRRRGERRLGARRAGRQRAEDGG